MVIETVVPLFSLPISLFSLVISFITYRENRKLSVKPVLIFMRRSRESYEKWDQWDLVNVGKGSALNILLGEQSENDWKRFTHCYPIAADSPEPLHLSWLKFGDALGVVYQDIDGRYYTTLCKSDKNQIKERNRFQWPSLNDKRVKSEFDRVQEAKH